MVSRKWGIVTGGASGIGFATARQLAEDGYGVALFDRNEAAVLEAADTLARAGHMVAGHVVDVTDAAGVAAAVGAVAGQVGSLWFLVNCAGWDSPRPFLETTEADWRRIADINLFGAMTMHAAVCPHMRDGGRIVNIASDAARVGASNCTVYSACKAGVIAFGKSLARELAARGILINTICPGPTDTPLFASMNSGQTSGQDLARSLSRAIPLGRIARPEDFVGMVSLLLGEGGAFITGQTISISGGLTMA